MSASDMPLSKATDTAVALVGIMGRKSSDTPASFRTNWYPPHISNSVRAAQLERLAAETDEASIHLGRVTRLL